MNELLLNNDLTVLNNSLQHDGRKGMRWGVFGASGATRFQPGAVYAKGMKNPNGKSIIQRLNEKRTEIKAKNDAKMITILPNQDTVEHMMKENKQKIVLLNRLK